jgi:PKD repeat protein
VFRRHLSARGFSVRGSSVRGSSARRSSLSAAASFAVESLELRRMLSYSIQTTITDPANIASEAFGSSVATHGNLAIVGSIGVAGAANDATSGRASLVDTSTGQVLHSIDNPDPQSGANFGAGVAFVGDRIAVSAPENFDGGVGKVYVWNSDADFMDDVDPTVITGSYANGAFGPFLATYGDNGLLVGTPSATTSGGAIDLYDLSSASPIAHYTNPAANDSDALGQVMVSDGTNIYATVNDSELGLRVVRFDGAGSDPASFVTAPAGSDGFFGYGLAAADGHLFVGDPGTSSVYELDEATDGLVVNTFTQPAEDVPGGAFGASIAVNGDRVAIGDFLTPDDSFFTQGTVYIYDANTGDSVDTIENPTPDDTLADNSQQEEFGLIISSAPDGKFVVANPFDDTAAVDSGAVYVVQEDQVVTNQPPVAGDIVGPSSGVTAQSLNFTGSFTDADAGDTHQVSWDFGDGNVIAFHSTDDAGALSVNHAYASTGAFTVTMTIQDGGGLTSSSTLAVDVTATAVQSGTLFVGGTGAADTVSLVQSNTDVITVTVGGVPTTFTGNHIVIYGGSGADTIDASKGVSAELEIYGGEGNDTIRGGGIGDILVGGDGNDTIYGGKGRDIIIGGNGSDSLVGNQDDDVLIAGRTVHDTDSAALNAIRTVWTGGATYDSRVSTLKSTVLRTSGSDLDVFDDGSTDTLVGSSGTDFFVFNVGADVVTDLKSFETATA